jgi:hypothetical protein
MSWRVTVYFEAKDLVFETERFESLLWYNIIPRPTRTRRRFAMKHFYNWFSALYIACVSETRYNIKFQDTVLTLTILLHFSNL